MGMCTPVCTFFCFTCVYQVNGPMVGVSSSFGSRSPQPGLSLILDQEAQYHLLILWMSLDSLINLYIYLFPKQRLPTVLMTQNNFFYLRETRFRNTHPYDSNVVWKAISEANVARLTLV